MALMEELCTTLASRGASIVGIADLCVIPEDVREGFPRGVAMAVAMDPHAVETIMPGPSETYIAEYQRGKPRLDLLSEFAAAFLKKNGFSALAITRAWIRNDPLKPRGVHRTRLPLKTFATRAGLGWIGKCAQLVTRQYGTAIRLAAVLTDAPLEPATPISTSLCGACDKCVKLCPAAAATGQDWHAGLERDEFFDPFKCKAKNVERGVPLGVDDSTCGLCIYTCPWTQRYLKRQISIVEKDL